MESLLKDPKFLTKCKDLALDTKLEPVPKALEEHWQTLMWVKGVIHALSWAGYEIVPKPLTKENKDA